MRQTQARTLNPLDKNTLRSTRNGESLWYRSWLRFRQHKLAMAGLICITLMILLAIFGPMLTPYDPIRPDYTRISSPPSAEHLFGTDRIGRDVFSRVLTGSRISLSVGLLSVVISITLGTLFGALAGYLGGWVDQLIMRMVDILMSIPKLLLLLTLTAALGPSFFIVMTVTGILSWVGPCRVVRGQILALREEVYVEAARSIGASPLRIMWVHLLPGVLPYLIVAATFGIAGGIMAEASLGFLGLGVQPPEPSWGNMINAALDISVLIALPWLWIPPAVAISLAVLSVNFIGDGLRDALDPKAMVN